MLRYCTYCNTEEAQPPNPRYQVQPGNEILEPLALVGCKISGRSILRHAGIWVGNDYQECLELVYASRGKAKFDYDTIAL